jgi:uncharacterized protein (TIGR02145 family)
LLNINESDVLKKYKKITIDSTGFNVLFFGWRNINGTFEVDDSISYFWSSTSNYSDHAWGLEFRRGEKDARLKRLLDKECGFSVRCVKDN